MNLTSNSPLGMSREFIAYDSHPVDSPTSLEVRLYIFWCRAVVDLDEKN